MQRKIAILKHFKVIGKKQRAKERYAEIIPEVGKSELKFPFVIVCLLQKHSLEQRCPT